MSDAFEFQVISRAALSAAKEAMAALLESKRYNPAKTSEWIEGIGGAVLAHMREAAPNFKFIVSVVLVQRVGAGLHYEMQSFWDPSTDGAVVATFENESITCVTTVIGVAL
jgi:hypothetical protein